MYSLDEDSKNAENNELDFENLFEQLFENIDSNILEQFYASFTNRMLEYETEYVDLDEEDEALVNIDSPESNPIGETQEYKQKMLEYNENKESNESSENLSSTSILKNM